MANILIIGDIHGRKFWYKAKELINEIDKVIFLGDYLDPYTSHENITQEEAIINFKEILEFTRTNKDKVILLYGNHCQFYLNKYKRCCRHDYQNYDIINKLFIDNKDLFQYAFKFDKYLFTHAGVCSGWIEQNNLNLDEFTIVDYLNSNPESLWQIGYSRGGNFMWGSPLWCCWVGDWVEFDYINKCNNPFDLIQIFGHTNVGKQDFPLYLSRKKVYMCDVQNCFILNTETGEIKNA